MENRSIILFDGVCSLCNGTVNFIIERDNKNVFKFAALQSETGQSFLKKFNKDPDEMNTLILIDHDNYYEKSTALLRISKELKGFWKLFYVLIIIPPFFRNFIYKIIAKNRYNWFGKRNTCMLPSRELQDKFL